MYAAGTVLLNERKGIRRNIFSNQSQQLQIPPSHFLNTPSPTYRIHLEVHQLATGQRNDHLPLIDGTLGDGLLARGFPLVDTLVRPDVPNAVRIDLHQRIVAKGRTAQRGGCSEKTTVGDFLDRVADTQDQRGVHERHDDVRVEFLCK